MRQTDSKDEILMEISSIAGTPFRPTVRGGTVTRAFVDDMASLFNVDAMGSNKTEVLAACLTSVGLPWRSQFDSTRSNSGGGGTITYYGLLAIRNAVIDLLSSETNYRDDEGLIVVKLESGIVSYVIAPEIYNHEGDFAPGKIDPDILGDGYVRHNKTQNRLAEYLSSRQCQVRSAKVHEPKFDLFWTGRSGSYVCEIKSLTTENQESQVRKAIGQVLRYQSQLRAMGISCSPVVVTDIEVTDPTWIAVFQENGMHLSSAPMFNGIGTLT
jgi:hypothetical protein